MNGNLIEIQRAAANSGNLVYEGSPSPEKTLTALGLVNDDLPKERKDYTERELMNLTPAEAKGYRMLRLAENAQFIEVIPQIRQALVEAGAEKTQFDRLECFEKYHDPKNEGSRTSAMELVRDACNLRTKLENELTKTPAGQLDYSRVLAGQRLQPQTSTFGNGQTVPGQLNYSSD